jgi:hypothetical protein
MPPRAQRLVGRAARKGKIVKSHGSAGLALAVVSVLGAAIAGMIGSGADTPSVAQGRGLLVLAGWRLETPILFAAAWAVFSARFMIQIDRRSRAHAEELREVARTLGLTYEEGDVKDSRGQHPERRYSNAGASVRIARAERSTALPPRCSTS